MTRRISIILIAAVVIPAAGRAQYWGERVQEKGFEETEFLFMPNVLNPYGLGSFRGVSRGLIADPFLSLSVNPAHAALDSATGVHIHTDVRSVRTVNEEHPYGVYPLAADAAVKSSFIPYPVTYTAGRRVLEPVFSAGILGRVTPDLTLGMTYQLMLQDEKYYAVPQNIYRSVLGEDYAGNKAAAASSIPITDVSSGDDRMRQEGHLAALYGSMKLSDVLRAGVKIGRTFFNRHGISGNRNSSSNAYATNSTWLWGNGEARSQAYNHWEGAGGLEADLGGAGVLGVTAGYLNGIATQALTDTDTSYSLWGTLPSGSLYQSSGRTLQEWTHDGSTVTLGLDYAIRASSGATVRFLYEHLHTHVDLGLGSSIADTSFSKYGYTDNGTVYSSQSNSVLIDRRGGSGTRVTNFDRALVSADWQVDERVRVSAGVQLDWMNTEMSTAEWVSMRGASRYAASSGGYNWTWETLESKDLIWTFSSKRRSFQVPIILTARAAAPVELMVGLNRVMSWSSIDDVTLAVIHRRWANSNGSVTDAGGFGERYTSPTDEASDIRTTFMAGITASVSNRVKLRLQVTPSFRDTYDGTTMNELQWWISVEASL
jgi:hypothetical protein